MKKLTFAALTLVTLPILSMEKTISVEESLNTPNKELPFLVQKFPKASRDVIKIIAQKTLENSSIFTFLLNNAHCIKTKYIVDRHRSLMGRLFLGNPTCEDLIVISPSERKYIKTTHIPWFKGTAAGPIQIYDATSLFDKCLVTLDERLHGFSVEKIKFNATEKIIILFINRYDSEDDVQIWNSTTGKLLYKQSEVQDAEFNRAGDKVIIISNEKATIWNCTTKEVDKVLNDDAKLCSASFSPNSNKIITGSETGSVKIWDLETSKIILSLEEHDDPVRVVQFDKSGEKAYTLTSHQLKTWNTETGECLKSVYLPYPIDGRKVELNHSANLLLVTTCSNILYKDKVHRDNICNWRVQLINFEGEERASFKVGNCISRFAGGNAATFNQAGDKIFTHSCSRSSKIYDITIYFEVKDFLLNKTTLTQLKILMAIGSIIDHRKLVEIRTRNDKAVSTNEGTDIALKDLVFDFNNYPPHLDQAYEEMLPCIKKTLSPFIKRRTFIAQLIKNGLPFPLILIILPYI